MSFTFEGFSSELNQSSELSSEEIAKVYFPEEIKKSDYFNAEAIYNRFDHRLNTLQVNR